mmetsp:Transcript_42434/g.88673  ORF Transcript_42434/g.88673 Transcript_42434/m.88673 type:complete len:93 (+) Transcript_42434:219-497(+)
MYCLPNGAVVPFPGAAPLLISMPCGWNESYVLSEQNSNPPAYIFSNISDATGQTDVLDGSPVHECPNLRFLRDIKTGRITKKQVEQPLSYKH